MIVTAACCAVGVASCASTDGHARRPVRSLLEIRQHNVVMQKWDLSCGAAALATVLTYHFHDGVSERTVAANMLRRKAPEQVTARGGFSLLDLKHFAETRGYKAAAYRQLRFADLTQFENPIVPISTPGGNHFVVLRSAEADRVHLADPAFGNRTISARSFQKAWLGGMAFVVTAKQSLTETRFE